MLLQIYLDFMKSTGAVYFQKYALFYRLRMFILKQNMNIYIRLSHFAWMILLVFVSPSYKTYSTCVYNYEFARSHALNDDRETG